MKFMPTVGFPKRGTASNLTISYAKALLQKSGTVKPSVVKFGLVHRLKNAPSVPLRANINSSE